MALDSVGSNSSSRLHCSFWEFGALVRQEKLRRDEGCIPTGEDGLKFQVPSLFTWRISGLDEPADPESTLDAAIASAREKSWITVRGTLSDQWYEIVTTLLQGSPLGYLSLQEAARPETRVMVSARHGLAYRIVLRGEDVWVDEIPPSSLWNALVDCLPAAQPAQAQAVTVDAEVLQSASAAAAARSDKHREWLAYELGQRGVASTDAYALATLMELDSSAAMAQFVVGLREFDASEHTAPFGINVLHGTTGRCAIIPELTTAGPDFTDEAPDGQSVVVTPATSGWLVSRLQAFHDDLAGTLADHREQRTYQASLDPLSTRFASSESI